MMRYSIAVVFITGLLLASCASMGAGGSRDADRTNETRPGAADRVADYESFDPSPYRESAPEIEVRVNHRVPDRLMQGRAVEGVRRTVEGYRVQIFSSQDKHAANQKLEETLNWWQRVQSEAPADLFEEELSAVIEYGQPYYRVRIGAFEERKRAERAMKFIQQQYPDAFIARTTITVME